MGRSRHTDPRSEGAHRALQSLRVQTRMAEEMTSSAAIAGIILGSGAVVASAFFGFNQMSLQNQITALKATQSNQGRMMVSALNPRGGNNQGAWATVLPMCKHDQTNGALTQSQLVQLCREWDMPLGYTAGQEPDATTTATQVTRRTSCPLGARQCVTTPYKSSKYGPGTAGLGLLLIGSRGMGGTQLELVDTERGGKHAPEIWFSEGNVNLAYKKGWVGGDVCIWNAVTDNIATWKKACLTYNGLEWLNSHDK